MTHKLATHVARLQHTFVIYLLSPLPVSLKTLTSVDPKQEHILAHPCMGIVTAKKWLLQGYCHINWPWFFVSNQSMEGLARGEMCFSCLFVPRQELDPLPSMTETQRLSRGGVDLSTQVHNSSTAVSPTRRPKISYWEAWKTTECKCESTEYSPIWVADQLTIESVLVQKKRKLD